MTREQWKDVSHKIQNSFTVTTTYTEDLEPGTAEVIEFTTPHGLLKARFIERPRVIDKQTLYAHRGSASVQVTYQYDEKDVTARLEVYRWDEEQREWREVRDASLF